MLIIYYLLFLFFFIFYFSLCNIYFNALSGADTLSTEILFTFGEYETPYDNQGLLYYFIVSFFIKLRSPSFNYSKKLEELTRVDQIFLSETILFANLILFILGLIGLYSFMKVMNLSKSKSIFVLIFLCYFPSIYYLRLNMKPEILALHCYPGYFIFLKII